MARESVNIHLTTSKCMPILLCGLQVLPLNKLQLRFLDFMVNRFLMKLFNSNDMQTIEFCRLQFDFKMPSEQIGYHCKKFASSEFLSILCVYTVIFFIYLFILFVVHVLYF